MAQYACTPSAPTVAVRGWAKAATLVGILAVLLCSAAAAVEKLRLPAVGGAEAWPLTASGIAARRDIDTHALSLGARDYPVDACRGGGPASASVVASRTFMSAADRVLFAEYRVLERDRVPMILAVRPECTAAAAGTLRARGAAVVGRRDAIGYLYAQVPIGEVESLPGLEGLLALQMAANPWRSTMDVPVQPAGSKERRVRVLRGAPPSSSLPPDNPYTGEAATQALAFKSEHPTFDGRGVIAAFVEPVAPDLATMRGALDISGAPLPKFAFYDLGSPLVVGDPVASALNIWQRTDPVLPDMRGEFSWRGQRYRLPSDVVSADDSSRLWRICRRLPAWFQTGHEAYDVLWAVDLDRVWVLPVSLGTDFSRAVSTSLSTSVAWVPLGTPGTRQPYDDHGLVFSADKERRLLGFSGAGAGHAGMVGSVMAGVNLLGSQANGVAPAAQVAIFHGAASEDAASQAGLERILSMIADPRVDVAESSYFVGDTSRFGDAAPHALWADRLVRDHGTPFVVAAGNFGAQLFGINAFAMAAEAFSVGAYTPRETWVANFGIAPHAEHALASYSAYGPARDGGLKPDFLALTHTLSEGGSGNWYWADTPELRGYGVSGGTSASAPHAAGHFALLVSAARQKGIPHDVPRLRAAIATTAKFLDGVEARAQGHGLIQVADAWRALQRARSWEPPSFTVAAPLVGAEARPGGADRFAGRGLLELSGWRPGQRGRRLVTVTRTSGAAHALRHRLRWKGDTEAFTSALRDIDFPLGRPVSIPVDIAVGASGAYSAILDIVDSDTDLVAGSILFTVMVADPLPDDGSALRYRRESPRPGNSTFYIDVPLGLEAMTVKVDKDGGKSIWRAQDPTGRQMPFSPYGSEVDRSDAAVLTKREQKFVYRDPVPGVWQFWMQNAEPHSMEDLEAVADWSRPMPLEVEVRGWQASEGPVSAPESRPVRVTFRNTANVRGAAIRSLGMGATRTVKTKLEPGLTPTFIEVRVDPGTSMLELQLEHDASGAQVGLYVFKEPEGERRETSLRRDDTALVYYDASFRTDKRYQLRAPPPGRYRIALDPIQVPAQGLEVAFWDTVYHPDYGSLNVNEIALQGGAKAAVVNFRVRTHPTDGRGLRGQVGLIDDPDAEANPIATHTWMIEP